jgi:hypothetical protein
MTKTLTEQWRKRTLERGYYYYKTKSGAKVIGYQCFGFEFPYDYYHNTLDYVKEVLAPVPNYDELQSYEKCVDMLFDVNKKWERTIKERKRLEKKLEIATKALKLYADVGNWCDCLSWNGFTEDSEVVEDGQFGENGYEPAHKALKEMKKVK